MEAARLPKFIQAQRPIESDEDRVHLPKGPIERPTSEAADVVHYKAIFGQPGNEIMQKWHPLMDIDQIDFRENRLNARQGPNRSFEDFQLVALNVELEKVRRSTIVGLVYNIIDRQLRIGT